MMPPLKVLYQYGLGDAQVNILVSVIAHGYSTCISAIIILNSWLITELEGRLFYTLTLNLVNTVEAKS